MKIRNTFIGTSVSLALVVAGTGVAAADPLPSSGDVTSPSITSGATFVDVAADTSSGYADGGEPTTPKVTPEEFKKGLAELVEQGKLTVVSSTETSTCYEQQYGIVDPDSGQVFMTFATSIPKYQYRIWGGLWGWEPSLTFNQTDQTAIATGGTAAVAAMATAAAAVLAETVVGSVISAGAIAFVGTAASVYVSKYGHCPASRPTLWVGLITHRAACR